MAQGVLYPNQGIRQIRVILYAKGGPSCPYGGGIYRKAVKVAPEQFEQYQWRGCTIDYHRAQIRKLHGFRETTVDDPTGIAQTTVAIAHAFGKPPGVDAAHLQPRHALWEVPPGHDRAIGN